MALSRLGKLVSVVSCVIYASGATAHEFWIEAETYQVPSGGQIVANLKNGQNLEGTTLSYLPRNFTRFDLVDGDEVIAVEGRLGDRPALNMPGPDDGLIVAVHETTPAYVNYTEWEKFAAFAAHKDFADIAARHAANGFPDAPFKERYTRHAKALIAVGDGAGADREVGLKTEFVALSNPYEPGFDNVMRVQVLLRGAPRPDAQVEVFDRPGEGDVQVTLHRTDANGIAAIPVTPGHDYLFDAVVLEPIAGDETAVWDTYWAALTFDVPAP